MKPIIFMSIIVCMVLENRVYAANLKKDETYQQEIEKKLVIAFASMQQVKNQKFKQSWKNIYEKLWQELEKSEREVNLKSMEQHLLAHWQPNLGQNLKRYGAKNQESSALTRRKSPANALLRHKFVRT